MRRREVGIGTTSISGNISTFVLFRKLLHPRPVVVPYLLGPKRDKERVLFRASC